MGLSRVPNKSLLSDYSPNRLVSSCTSKCSIEWDDTARKHFLEGASSEIKFQLRNQIFPTDSTIRPPGERVGKKLMPKGSRRRQAPLTNASLLLAGALPTLGASFPPFSPNSVLGDPLTEEEVAELVERYRHSDCSSQINLGKGGVTHNMLEDIHNHWKRAEAVRLKCLGVPTLDMDNVCFHLEDKTGGKIIFRNINILLLYRGRNYDPKKRPVIPVMLWKPLAPIYPKLVQNVAQGLTFEETKELRNRGLNAPALMKLTRNGVYVNVVERVREAFGSMDVIRLDCSHVYTSDCKKIGVKLRDLVPCIPILFKDGQIILWRGNANEDSNSS
ncbi:hypothetical protein ZIOFF_019842 [Zingiber officinale]|uniref:CRM domain-containing protein n=1 Tax=Zingiber officinale TaxID=94328 RepID=A0A8J5LJH5_ZINOF|nr:hypothetical protein ZIOFF_019842 [Zingiber officinale]